MQEPDNPASSTPPALGSTPSIVLAIFLYVILADAAVETFVHGSPGRWITAGAVTAYAALTALLWRRSSWEIRAVASSLMLLFLLVLTAWLPDGVTQGIMLAGHPTSTVLTVATALAVLLAGAALAGARVLPPPARWAAGIIAAYGTVAFLFGIVAGTPYADLFHGAGLWDRLPFWLQGPFVSAVILVPAAVIFLIVTSLQRGPSRSAPWSRHGLQIVGVSAGVLLTVSGLRTPVGFEFGPTETWTPAGIARLSPVTFARGESGAGPVGPTSRFQEGIKAVYAFVEFDGLTAEDTVGSVWYRGAENWYKGTEKLSQQKSRMSEKYAASVPGKGRLWFSLQDDQGLLPDHYFLEISINDVPAQAGTFIIEPQR